MAMRYNLGEEGLGLRLLQLSIRMICYICTRTISLVNIHRGCITYTCVQMLTCTQSHIQGSPVVKFHVAFRDQCFFPARTFMLLHFLFCFFIATQNTNIMGWMLSNEANLHNIAFFISISIVKHAGTDLGLWRES